MVKTVAQIAVPCAAAALLSVQPAEAYPIDCAIFLCLAGGWPNSPDCNVARAEFIRRITPYPVEPPLQLWRCPIGAAAGSTTLSPMQRLKTIKDTSTNPLPVPPSGDEMLPQVAEVSFLTVSGKVPGASPESTLRQPKSIEIYWANLEAGAPTLSASTLTVVDLSSSDFDVVRSIRVWDVRHYSHKRGAKDDEQCRTSLDMVVGTYDENANFSWSEQAPDTRPNWLPLRRQCPSYFRGVGVEWSDAFGRYGYELIPY